MQINNKEDDHLASNIAILRGNNGKQLRNNVSL